MRDKRRDLRPYRKKVAAAKHKALHSDEPTICHLCRRPIDMTLHYTDRWAFTLDHDQALAAGGHILGPTFPAHRACNSAKGKGDNINRTPTSRDW